MSIQALHKVELFTDGACSGNPGAGGWGVVLRCDSKEKELKGGNPQTTNNQMELKAVIEGLKALKYPCDVVIYTDSQYVRRGALEWMKNWKKNGWKTADKQPVKNQDLWKELESLLLKHHIEWVWIKGHSGHPENERADALARSGVKNINP